MSHGLEENPIFPAGARCALVERTDRPGLLGAAVRGGRFVCALPEGYDGLTSITLYKGYLIVAHPTLPPLKCDPNTGKIDIIETQHVQGGNARMKLLTH